MGYYLDQFQSSLPTVQGKQLLRILQEKKDSGEIRSVEEFKSKLNQLTAALLAEELKPTLSLFLGAAAETIDSETYNFMLDRISDDLEAAFNEVTTIDEVLSAHNQIVTQVVLKSLQIAINDINDRLTLYEFINSNSAGFNRGQFNTFSATSTQPASRSGEIANVIYQNDTASSATIDSVGERLTLGYQDLVYAPLQDARQIFDAEVLAAEVDVRVPGSDIRNIIDGQKDTFWVYNTLLSSPSASGVIHKVEVSLAATQDINLIEIEPAAPQPMLLVGVTYIDNAGNEVDTGLVTPTVPVLLDGPVRLNFGRLTVRKLIFKVLQNNYAEVQFEEKDTSGVTQALRDVITSDFQLEELLGIPREVPTGVTHKMYQYLVGFDNIRPGLASYQEESNYVSKPLSADKPGLVGLRTIETRPEIEDASDASTNFSGSLEYEIVKENLDAAGRVVGIDRFPVLPAGVFLVEHERFDLTHKVSGTVENAGQLRFYPTSTEPKLYRNGTLMAGDSAPVPEWEFEPSISVSSPSAPTRMVQGIRIIAPAATDIYTATYTPALGNTTTKPSAEVLGFATNMLSMVNMGDGSRNRMVQENVVVTDRVLPATTIEKSNIYLIIVLRRNTTDEHLTPAVEEYMLLTNTEEESKFESISE